MLSYSPTARGFFHAIINAGAIPGDAIPITEEEHAALLAEQEKGAEIVPGTDGRPLAEHPQPPSEG